MYNRHDSKIGTSSFVVSHKLTKKELADKINDAIYSAKFVGNKDYNLVNGTGKKTIKDKPFDDEFDTMIEKIHNIQEDASNKNAKFNAVEIFYNEKNINVVNSKNNDEEIIAMWAKRYGGK